MEIVLQERMTLDDVIKKAVKTYRNGCNFRLFVDASGAETAYILTQGCYLLYNLLSHEEQLLYNWLRNGENNHDKEYKRVLNGNVIIDTLEWLQTRKPCECCGAPLFKSKLLPELQNDNA